jgi:ParB-like chromosome segregation protein Spo0J
MSDTTTVKPAEFLQVPLDAIVIREGFNPRGRFDKREITRLAATANARRAATAVRAPNRGRGPFELVAGERRYRAAGEAELVDVPVIVTAHEDVDAGDLVSALDGELPSRRTHPCEGRRRHSRGCSTRA